jgi:hypothetical protein
MKLTDKQIRAIHLTMISIFKSIPISLDKLDSRHRAVYCECGVCGAINIKGDVVCLECGVNLNP